MFKSQAEEETDSNKKAALEKDVTLLSEYITKIKASEVNEEIKSLYEQLPQE